MGRPVGTKGAVIDQFGDAVLCCAEIPGDAWRHRHDVVKMAIYLEAVLAKVPANCDLLPAALEEEGGELQWGRARQGKVPDFQFLLPSLEGPTQRLAELKVVSAGKTWFPRGVAGKGTDRRAARLTTEYETKLREYDVRFHGPSRDCRASPCRRLAPWWPGFVALAAWQRASWWPAPGVICRPTYTSSCTPSPSHGSRPPAAPKAGRRGLGC